MRSPPFTTPSCSLEATATSVPCNQIQRHPFTHPSSGTLQPTSTTSRLAECLPFHILITIFQDADRCEHDDDLDHGGERVGWNSTEGIASMTLVCRAWTDAASFVLFTSVALFGGESARLFLGALTARPERAALVRSLVIGLRCEEETSDHERIRHLSESEDLVKVLEACPRLLHLQVRPLHKGVRSVILDAIASKALVSLVVSPRLGLAATTWGRGLFNELDLAVLATPNLERLELNFNTFQSTSLFPGRPTSPIQVHPHLSLSVLRVFASAPDSLIFKIIGESGSTLKDVDIYIETVPGRQSLVDAFHSAGELRSLRFATNPTLQALEGTQMAQGLAPFDIICPCLRKVRQLYLSASEVSQDVFRLVCPSLQHLEIDANSGRSLFHFTPSLVQDIRNTSFSLGLTSFTLLDTWATHADVAQIRRACRARGITFLFVGDGLADEGAEDSEDADQE